MKSITEVCGIDYGSKLAGTTSICYRENDEIRFVRSAKKQDADKMILDFCNEFMPALIAIDAPLSLPGVFQGLAGFEDYFYRRSDKELKAMSPMFIGGLTARAIKLKNQLRDVEVIEAYPVFRGKQLMLTEFGYRTKTPDYPSILKKLGFPSNTNILSSHDLDALITLEIVERYSRGEAKSVGDELEGLIYY